MASWLNVKCSMLSPPACQLLLFVAFILPYKPHLVPVASISGVGRCLEAQYISLKDLPELSAKRADPAGQQSRETDPRGQMAPTEAPGVSWACTSCRAA